MHLNLSMVGATRPKSHSDDSVTCHPIQMNVHCLNPSQKGLHSIYLPQTNRRLSWPQVVGYTPRWFTCPQTVTHPDSNQLTLQRPDLKVQWATSLFDLDFRRDFRWA